MEAPMSRNTTPLQVKVPPRETALINPKGELVLTYKVTREKDGREWRDLDENRAHEAILTVSGSFDFVFETGRAPLLTQLIVRARECFDPAVLSKAWVMETKPSGRKGYVNAAICQNEQPNFGDPFLQFDDDRADWLETYFYS